MKYQHMSWENRDDVNAILSMCMDYCYCAMDNPHDEDKRAIIYKQICNKIDEVAADMNVELKARLENLRKALEAVT